MCLRIGKLSITQRIGGLLRANYVQSLEDVLREKGRDANPVDQFSAPVVAWFKPHSTLALTQLFSATITPLEDNVLSDTQVQALFDQFFLAVYPVCSLVSREDIHADGPCAKPLRLATIYAAAVSLPLLQSQKSFGMSKDALVKRLKSSAESALCEAEVFSQLDVRLFQALLIYLTPQFLAEISRSHSIYLGAVIRHFQIAGFDKDSEEDPDAARDTKRHLWQHLLFLNIRAAEAVGPERTVVDDSTSVLPQAHHIRGESSAVLDTSGVLLSLIRYECYRIHRLIFRERENIKKGTLAFSSFLGTLDQLISNVQTKYLNQLDDRIPIEKYAGLVGKLLLARAESMTVSCMREGWIFLESGLNLRERATRSCLEIVETSVLLETDPDLAPWAWYVGAYHQYHSILLLLVIVYQTPDIPEADRIIAMIDHVFGPSAAVASQDRSMTVLRAIKDNLASFIAAVGSSDSRLSPRLSKVRPQQRNDAPMPTPLVDSSMTALEGLEPDGQHLPYLDLDCMSPSISAEDIWWPWPPHMPLLEQDDPFGLAGAFSSAHTGAQNPM